VFDDIKRTRQVDDVNNFWKYLAHDPALLARTWASVREVNIASLIPALRAAAVGLAPGPFSGVGAGDGSLPGNARLVSSAISVTRFDLPYRSTGPLTPEFQ
jgi:hypothetical protein